MVVKLSSANWLMKMSKSDISGAQAIKIFVDAYTLCRTTESVEQTKRLQITADRDIKIAEIEAKKDLLESFMKSAFNERADMIHGFFERLDLAIEKRDYKLMENSIGAILAVARQSPIFHSKELIAAMNNPDVDVIDI